MTTRQLDETDYLLLIETEPDSLDAVCKVWSQVRWDRLALQQGN